MRVPAGAWAERLATPGVDRSSQPHAQGASR